MTDLRDDGEPIATESADSKQSEAATEENPLTQEEKLERLLLHEERSCIFERAAMCRDRGSAQFKLKNVAKAIEWYERALFHVDFDEGTWHFEFMDKHRDAVNEVRLPVHLNLAMCYLGDSAQDLAKVVEHADLALAIDAKNAKALYRGGKAHLLNGNLDQARKKLKLAAQIQPNDKNIREALQTLAEKSAEARAKEKETWGGRLLDGKASESDVDEPAEVKSKPTPTNAQTKPGGQLSSASPWRTPVLVVLVAVVTGFVLLLVRRE